MPIWQAQNISQCGDSAVIINVTEEEIPPPSGGAEGLRTVTTEVDLPDHVRPLFEIPHVGPIVPPSI